MNTKTKGGDGLNPFENVNPYVISNPQYRNSGSCGVLNVWSFQVLGCFGVLDDRSFGILEL